MEAAAEWYSKMRERSLVPGARTLSAAIIACAKAGRADAAEVWLQRMEECGIAPNVVAYSSAIDASSKAEDPERAVRLFERMRAHGVKANIVTFASVARPLARKGNWAAVERLDQQMEEEGLQKNEYFLYALLDAYGNSSPRQPQRATAAFQKAMATGLEANDHVQAALSRVLGRPQARELLQATKVSTKQATRRSGVPYRPEVPRGPPVRRPRA